MTTKIAIFDLDGTLLNTIADLGEACNHALKYFGFVQHSADEYPKLVGNGVNRLIERALPDGEKTENNILKLREVFIPYYNLHNKVHTCPYDGITEVLHDLKKNGWYIAVASNKYQAATTELVNHYFPNMFDVVLGEREGCKRKPNPQIVRDILCELDKLITNRDINRTMDTDNLSEIIYIGDSDVDMQTARNAGLTAVACTWGFCTRQVLEQYNPQYIIDHPIELLTITKQM